ncbi:MOSC domain protein [mine drainage metagenome]|uniref:MOSC domain protein n=1 Tax=mine drainage metagenome TaxID=410659 RepID=A0A1J5RP54_9ZZZZ
MSSELRILHLYLSPAHNYFGHHGGPAGEEAVVEVPEVECVAGRGLRGDRFFDYKPDYKGQLTLFSWEVFEQLRRELGAPDVPPAALRRNAIVAGADLNALVGRRFRLQGVELEGSEECRPCYWMDQAIAQGSEAWLKGRGGLRCRILSNGVLHSEAAVAAR